MKTVINRKDLNEKVRPQDDFFEYSNGGWIKRAKIPEVESSWGTFHIVHDRNRKRIRKLIEENAKKSNIKKGSDEQKMRDLYHIVLDMKRRNKDGITPLNKFLTEISDTKNKNSLIRTIASLSRAGIAVPWAIGVDLDDKNSNKMVLRFHQSGLGMSNKDYYLKKDKESTRIKTAYKKHILGIHELLGLSTKESKQCIEVVISMEMDLARASMTRLELRDVSAQYNKKTITSLSKLAPAINFKTYLKDMGVPVLRSVIVDQPKFLKGVNILVGKYSLDEWKIYLRWHLVNGYAGALSDKFVNENFDFYTKTIFGVKKMRPIKERASMAVDGNLGELVGKLYVSRYFPKEAKKKVNELIDNLISAYGKRIRELDWMSETTKKKALKKLSMVVRKVGFPDTWLSYSKLFVDPKLSYVENLMVIGEFYWKREVEKLSKPVDRKEWVCTPQTVNAFNHANMNSINFPAGILQPPFFDMDGDMALNYGAMGSVIGHELSHGFDDDGAKFDGHGNIKNWWTKKDKEKFEKKGKMLTRQFSAYEVKKGLFANGELTLGENIGDLGGLVVGYAALKEAIRKNEISKDKKFGFTPEQRYFFGLSLFERNIYRDEYLQMIVRNDTHAPAECRVNGPLSNMEEFYETFDVKKGDKLYRDKKNRVVIW